MHRDDFIANERLRCRQVYPPESDGLFRGPGFPFKKTVTVIIKGTEDEFTKIIQTSKLFLNSTRCNQA